MNHLDEGTIHAWLDGALSATQSAEVDAHVKTCAECSAAVAEARGLIAASSRILTALDDVPANVIPKPVAAPVRRRWGAAPWISGLAAAAIIVTLWRTGGVEQPTRSTEIAIPELKISTSLPEPSLGPVTPPPDVAASRSAEIQQSRQSVAKAPPVASGRGAAAAIGSVSATDLAANQPAPPLAPVPAAVESRATALRDERLRRESVSEVVVTAAAEEGRSDSIAGCYRLPARMVVEAVQVTAGAAEAMAARTARPDQRRAVTSAAPAAQQKSIADAAVAWVIVRLDTLGRVRSGADSIGAWERLPGDSARVVANSRSTIVSGADKVRCP